MSPISGQSGVGEQVNCRAAKFPPPTSATQTFRLPSWFAIQTTNEPFGEACNSELNVPLITCCNVKLWPEAGLTVELRRPTKTTRITFQDMSRSLLRDFVLVQHSFDKLPSDISWRERK